MLFNFISSALLPTSIVNIFSFKFISLLSNMFNKSDVIRSVERLKERDEVYAEKKMYSEQKKIAKEI